MSFALNFVLDKRGEAIYYTKYRKLILSEMMITGLRLLKHIIFFRRTM